MKRLVQSRRSQLTGWLLLLLAGCSGTNDLLFKEREPSLVAAPLPGGGMGATAIRDAGPLTEEPLDPNADFDWMETVPGQGTCKPGTYSGPFGCTPQGSTLVASVLGPLGTVTLTLGQPTEQQLLPVTRGTLAGLYSATVQGSLDCSTNALSAQSHDGLAVQLDGLMGIAGAGADFVSFPSFSARLDGALDRATQVIEGTFAMTSDDGRACTGFFRANAMP